MASGPSISQQKILSASQGDSASLREVLQQMSQVHSQTQTVIGTTPTQGTAGQPNRYAAVPPQATVSVSLLDGSWIIQIVNPGATSAISQIQAAQNASIPEAIKQGNNVNNAKNALGWGSLIAII
jgi:hypothetical protein